MAKINKRVIFLDFDGVIRLIPTRDPAIHGEGVSILPAEMVPHKMAYVAKACVDLDADIVVTSDWRKENALTKTNNLDEVKAMLEPHIPWYFLHTDWCTPVWSFRYREVELWLEQHPEVTDYVILEDMPVHFEDASEAMKQKIVWCSHREGLQEHMLVQLYNTLDPADPATIAALYNLPLPTALCTDVPNAEL